MRINDRKNTCYTYFQIIGNFDPDEVTALLGLQPEEMWKIGDLQKNGRTKHTFARWTVGHCAQYDPCIENQMRQTIAPLLDKIHLLNQIWEQNDVTLRLEIVPTVYADDTSPCLAPPLDIVDFCHATRTEIDIDLYVLGKED